MNWLVNIDFKRGPALGLEVEAATNTAAIAEAKRLAPQYGFSEPMKGKPKARLLTEAERAERRAAINQ